MIASLTDVKVEIPGTNGLLEYWERSLFLKFWSTGLLLLGEIPTGVLDYCRVVPPPRMPSARGGRDTRA